MLTGPFSWSGMANLFFLCALNPGPQINKILDMAPDPDHHSRAVEIMAAKEEAINLEDQS